MNFIFPYIGNVIIPSDELIFFRGVGIPPTSIYIYMLCVYIYIHIHTYIHAEYVSHFRHACIISMISSDTWNEVMIDHLQPAERGYKLKNVPHHDLQVVC
jgi:hypothetical protein